MYPFSSSPFLFSLQMFLESFGYMKKHDPNHLVTREELRPYVAKMQSFYNLPVTSELDAETVAAIKRPRCGGQRPQRDRERVKRRARDPVQQQRQVQPVRVREEEKEIRLVRSELGKNDYYIHVRIVFIDIIHEFIVGIIFHI